MEKCVHTVGTCTVGGRTLVKQMLGAGFCGNHGLICGTAIMVV